MASVKCSANSEMLCKHSGALALFMIAISPACMQVRTSAPILQKGEPGSEGLDRLPLVTASLRPVWGLPSSGTHLWPQVTHQLGEALSFMMLAARGHNLHQVLDSEAMGSGLGALGGVAVLSHMLGCR